MNGLAIDFDIVADEELAAIRASALNLLDRLRTQNDYARELIWPSIDADCDAGAPKLMLVTLDRIGIEPGRSGATAFIAYFYVKDPEGPRNSRPMVIKIARRNPDRDRLDDEFEQAQALKLLIAQRHSSFALPVHFDRAHGIGDIGVLWAPFTAGFDLWSSVPGSEKISFSHSDLLSLLRPAAGEALDTTRHDQASQVIDRIYQDLRQVHAQRLQLGRLRKPACRERRSLMKEYQWYLRPSVPWRDHWEKVWAPSTRESAQDFGHTWVNPLWLLNALEEIEAELCVGGVHGDLHPRNVVLDADGNPHIIDFGWAQTDCHVVKDFVLLECNLRFVVLAPEIPFEWIRNLASWLSPGDPPPRMGSIYMEQRLELLTKLRQFAESHCHSSDKEWTLSYGVPLFLTAVGLLAHARNFDNLLAARLTILGLADRIASVIKSA